MTVRSRRAKQRLYAAGNRETARKLGRPTSAALGRALVRLMALEFAARQDNRLRELVIGMLVRMGYDREQSAHYLDGIFARAVEDSHTRVTANVDTWQ